MLRISATTLESFRLFMQPEQEWMTEEALTDTIRGVVKVTPQIQIGTAFGRVLEAPERFQVDGGYVCDGYSFADSVMAEPFALVDRARGLFEVKATKPYGDCLVVSRADHLIGARLVEFKTTTSSFDFEKYAASYQWRFMADTFQPLVITYHVFLLNDHGNGVVELRGVETFNLYPYRRLHEDCAALVGTFREYVTERGLDAVLRQRQIEAEAA